MERPRHAGPARRTAASLGAVLALGLLGGCGTARGAAAAPSTVEQIAGRIGCAKPSILVNAAELRQGMCRTANGGGFSVTTFATETGRDQWLADAVDYGGAYLIGPRWIVVGNTRQMLEPFRAAIGGTLRDGGHQMPSGAPMPPDHQMPSGHQMPPGHQMSSGTPMPADHQMPSGHSMPAESAYDAFVPPPA
ncbi:hypothetical protein Sru01_53090 [Sphaerisporangium rufum]|uniref:Lipoprotein n=1 Tax=Sphaerisporangium rufum TaxID=1381558 RepID=A0A919R608_9ACTN|nr:hypothetical protein [Sphaerisporangium rufum]GII80327.1 hypothetical protein Sru01_53090 [Sphaerisporangium rufum]